MNFFRSRTIQGRLALYMFIFVAFSFFLSTMAVIVLPQDVLNQIDNDLELLASQMLKQAVTSDGAVVERYKWPSTESYQTASSFFMVLLTDAKNDADGIINVDEHIIENRSDNLMGWEYNEPLNPEALDKNAANYYVSKNSEQPLNKSEMTKTYQDPILKEKLRVITIPLKREVAGDSDQLEIYGYLQVGRIIGDYTYYNDLITSATLISAGSFFGLLASLGFVLPSLFRPLSRIIDVAENISTAQDLSRRIPTPEVNDETGQLVRVLNQLMARIEQIFNSQKRLLGDVSHELRTPLTAIRGNVDLMRLTGEVDEESLAAIDGSAKRMGRLIDDLLMLARAESDSQVEFDTPIELDKVFLQVYEQLTIVRSPVQLVLTAVDPATVYGDADRLTQVIINLMTNAMKYTDPGGRAKVSLVREETHAIFTVADNGIGIPAEDLPHIFDRFYRVSKSRNRESGGTGLGLSIVKSIIETHKGDISVESTPNVGSTFTVRIPLAAHQSLEA